MRYPHANSKAAVPDKMAGAGLLKTAGTGAGFVADNLQGPRRVYVCVPGPMAGRSNKGRGSIPTSVMRDGYASASAEL